MKTSLTVEDLVKFEQEIADCFLQRKILAPIHLSSGNERQLIEVFQKHVGEDDWVLSTWRSHLHCLLRGVPKDELKQAILDGRSISLCFPKHRIFSSAIAGGVCPIAVGIAMGIKRKGEGDERKVVCFVGDMVSEMGTCMASMKYAANMKLPLLWVVEDNGKSVNTDTARAWGGKTVINDPSIIRYEYTNGWPHCGAGQWVTF